MVRKVIIFRGLKYFYYDTYKSWKEAYNTARWYNRKNKKNKYYIVNGDYRFDLYMTKIRRLGF